MRLSVYISEVVKFNQLSDIVATAEKENPSHKITGVLSYNHGYYLQIVEGDTAEVRAFDKVIRKDTRHQNVRMILNFETNKRFFSCWSINLAPLLKRNESFLSIIDHLNRNIDSISPEKKRLLSLFHTLGESKDQANEPSTLVYSINEWPDFKKVKATPSLRSICGALMHKPNSFRAIADQNKQVTDAELRAMLSQLNEAGYLKVTQLKYVNQVQTVRPSKKQQRNEFFNMIEKFGKSSLKLSLKGVVFQKASA